MNLQEVAGGKKFSELLLDAVNFTGYRLIKRTLHQCNCRQCKAVTRVQIKSLSYAFYFLIITDQKEVTEKNLEA